MINIVEDITKIVTCDKSHNVKVAVKSNGITISLIEGSFNDVCNIPIKYDCLEGIYIDNKKESLVFAILALLKILWNILKIMGMNLMSYVLNVIGRVDREKIKIQISSEKRRIIFMKTLKDTVEMMNSTDYKERFIAEYDQLVIRYKGLRNMLDKWDRDELEFKPTCPRSTYNMQIKAMTDYIAVLEARAVMENVEL